MKKLLSLFTILCCIFTFASFPALAAETSAQVVTFSDNFETETDTVPDNWRLYTNSSGAKLTVEEADGNKFLRLNPTQQCWTNEATAPIAITKEGKVNIPTDGGVVRVKMKFRVADITGANSMPTVRLAYPEETNGNYYTPAYANEYLLFVARDYGTAKDMFCYAGTSDNAVNSSGIALVNNKWYDVTAMMDYSAKTIDYIVGSVETGYKRFSSKINGSSLSKVDVIDNITVKLMQVNANNYTDIDDVSINYIPKAKNFYDNFETETDKVPDKWSVAATSLSTTATIEEENGNKYLHFTNSEQCWASALPSVVTKDNLIEMPLFKKPVLIKYRARMNIDSSSTTEFYIRASIPGGAASTTEQPLNYYKAIDIRKDKGVANLKYYPSAGNSAIIENIKFDDGVWYDIYAVADPRTSTIKYMVGNESGEYNVFNIAKFEPQGFASLDVINNIAAIICHANVGAYMDLDDVYIGYPEDYADYLPNVLSFEDTFEDAALNSVPANWIDRAGVSTVKVMEETGNKFVRVTKNANTKGVPQVATKDGVINRPWRGENGKGFVVEAKIRQQNQNYRSLLMLNAPYLPTAEELGQNIGTPFYIHTNLQAYNMPEYKVTDGVVSLNEWVHYRAVIIPGETQTTIHHYINDVLCYTTPTSAIKMPELFNPDSLYKVSFGWRSDISGTNDETVETEGYMDFDDVKVYEMTDFIHKITVTDANGAKIDKLVNGTVNVNANVINNGKTRQVDVIAALYSKDGDNWKLTGTKKVVNADNNSYVYAYAWKQGLANASLDVNDADQMLKVFVWNRAIDNDSNPANAETLTPMNPVCAPIVITR